MMAVEVMPTPAAVKSLAKREADPRPVCLWGWHGSCRLGCRLRARCEIDSVHQRHLLSHPRRAPWSHQFDRSWSRYTLGSWPLACTWTGLVR